MITKTLSSERLTRTGNAVIQARVEGSRSDEELDRAAHRWERALGAALDADPGADWTGPLALLWGVVGHPQAEALAVLGAGLDHSLEIEDRATARDMLRARWRILDDNIGWEEVSPSNETERLQMSA